MFNVTDFKSEKGKSGIYLFNIGEHQYVGSSMDLYERLKQHVNSANNNYHHNTMFQYC